MLTREQRLLLRTLVKRHAARTAVVVCLPGTIEWEIASRTLRYGSDSDAGTRFSGTPETLRTFFEAVNEQRARMDEKGSPTLYSVLHGG